MNETREEILKHAQLDLCNDDRTMDDAILKVRRMFFAEVGGGCFRNEAGEYLA